MKKFIKKIIRRLLLLVLIGLGVLWFLGYREYKAVINETPLEEKIKEVKQDPFFLSTQQIPVLFREAIVAVEDERYFQRDTVLDKEAVLRALWVNLKNFTFLQGASTIPQQVSKNLYYGHEQSAIRKVSEYYITKDLIAMQTKSQVLELYINIIYYGNGAHGLFEAADHYFDVLPWQLNKGELTILAGLPQAPSVYDLTQNFDLAKQRQAQVLYRMVDTKKITQEEADAIYAMEVIGYE